MSPPIASWIAPPSWFIYTFIFVSYVSFFIAISLIGRKLVASQTWSLGDALSEEADITVNDGNGLPYSVNGSPVKQTKLVASSSRLIALMGMLSILSVFLSFAAFVLWDFANSRELPSSTPGITKFLLGGMTLFAPYAVNKFSSVFSAN